MIETHEPWLFPTYAENCELPLERAINPAKEYATLKKGSGDSKGEPRFSKDAINTLQRRRNIRLKNIDLQLQSIFNYLEISSLVDKTAVILTADHGHMYPADSEALLIDSRVHVPLLIKVPNSNGGIIKTIVNNGTDMASTILEIAGSAIKLGIGKSLLRDLQSYKDSKFVISESIFLNKYKVSIRDGFRMLHVTYRYNPAQRLINLSQKIDVRYFLGKKSVTEISSDNLLIFKEMNDHIKIHLAKNASNIKYQE
jgi:hypothetical protein